MSKNEVIEDGELVAAHECADTMWNDAYWHGEDHPDMHVMLKQSAVFMTGAMYGQKDRRNTQDGDWKRVEKTWRDWIAGGGEGKNQWGLSRHPVAKSKEGSAIVLAESLDGARKDAAIKTMYAIGLDIDSGAALDDVLDTLEEKGLFAVVYTSFRNGTTELVLKHDDIMRKLKLDESPTRAQVQTYLREHHKDRYDEAFINGIKVVEGRKQTPDGLRTILETPALDKFRVVLPLWEPVELADLGATVNQWKDVWADAVTGVAINTLGVNFDSTSCDVNRLFFTPRHPADAEDWYCAVVQGRPLRFEEIEPFSKTAYVKDRDAGDAFAQAGGGSGDADVREEFFTPSGKSLNKWHNTHKDRFLIADAIETYCPDKVRVAGGEKPGTVHLECPFEHMHSSEGGTATMAMNPDENEMGYWTIFCKHDSCQERDKLEFVKEMLDQGWFEESVLYDEDWNVPLPDEDRMDNPEPTEEEKKTTPELQAAEFTEAASDDEIKKFIKRQIRLNCDNATQARINDALAKNTALDKTTLKKFWKEIRKELERKNDDGSDNDSIPVINHDNFKDMVHWGEQRILETNAALPHLFHYIDGIARIEETADRTPRIQMMTEKQFGAQLNNITTWYKETQSGEITRRVEKSAPADVIAQLYHSTHTIYPRLRGLVTTPTFVKGGDLVTKPGFHDSGIYYYNTGELDVPAVSAVPTVEEIEEAKRLLIEEVFADFPLGGMSRDEIVQEALDGEGIPAVANLMAMLLLMFCRDLIDGNSPGHLITKPTPGTGASLLTDICSKLAHGDVTPALPLPSNKDEMEKTLLTVISDGCPVIYFDNIEQSVDSGALASALTAPKFKGRRLGATQSITAEVRAVWILCGNNVRMTPELVRRLVMIDLDARMADPAGRKGWRHDDLGDYVLQNRGDLIWAALTLIQNWVAKGMKGDSSEILNSYENWSRVMGGILRDAGIKGFLGNRQQLKDEVLDDTSDLEGLLLAKLATFDEGTRFRSGSAAQGCINVQELLNAGWDETDNQPLEIPGYGFNIHEGEYKTSAKIGSRLTTLSKKPHRINESLEIDLIAEQCKKAKATVYVLKKTKRE